MNEERIENTSEEDDKRCENIALRFWDTIGIHWD